MRLTRSFWALPWRRAYGEWCRSDGVTWIYIFKTLLAAFLTLGVAMELELPHPRVAMVTVFIVMQVQSGPVFAKGFYRLLGTLVGAIVTVAVIAIIPQETTLLMWVLSIWIAVCCAGAQRHRNFRGYGYVLAGYTTVTVGLPVLAHPDQVFMSAVWRVIEISLGLLISTFVTAVVFPRNASVAMREAISRRLGSLGIFIGKSLTGKGRRADLEAAHLRFAAQAVGVEGLRTLTTFEDPHMRHRSRTLSRLNKEFMTLCTRFHALQQYVDYLGVQSTVTSRITPLLEQLREGCQTPLDGIVTPKDVYDLEQRMQMLRHQATHELLRIRNASEATEEGGQWFLEFDTVAQLLTSFIEEFLTYLNTHASLDAPSRLKESWPHTFQGHMSWSASLAAGLRGGLVVLTVGLFWLHTGWPSGAMATLIAAASVALSSTSPNPRGLALQMAVGTVGGAITGAIEYFLIYPAIDGLPLLCVVVAPVIALGAFLMSRATTFGYGVGVLVFFAVASIPDNPTHYDPYGFINDYVAMLLGMMVSTVAGAVILPPNRPWLLRRLEKGLRQLTAMATTAPLDGLSNHFESKVRDIVQQAYGLTGTNLIMRRELLRWMFMVLEVGHAIIELRAGAGHDSRPVSCALRSEKNRVLAALRAVFAQPSRSEAHMTIALLEKILAAEQANIMNGGTPTSTTYLEFIRMSLSRFDWDDKKAA